MVSQTKTVFIALTVLSALALLVAEARYLPTRSDDFQREQLREIIRGLLEKAEMSKPSGDLFGNLGGGSFSRGGELGAFSSRGSSVRSGLLNRDLGA